MKVTLKSEKMMSSEDAVIEIFKAGKNAKFVEEADSGSFAWDMNTNIFGKVFDSAQMLCFIGDQWRNTPKYGETTIVLRDAGVESVIYWWDLPEAFMKILLEKLVDYYNEANPRAIEVEF